MKTHLVVLSVLVFSFFLSAFVLREGEKSNLGDQTVFEVLNSLGEPKPNHWVEASDEKIRRGKDLIHDGRTIIDGKTTKYISKYFVCTNCHNTIQEDPVITKYDPDARLPYLVKKGFPFLQGSTFWGIVNRESWYNDDYYKKYGDLVKPANGSLLEAVRLCAVECSQGRELEPWEEEAILAYYWSIQLKMSDLQLSDEMYDRISRALSGTQDDQLVNELKQHYPLTSPATFMDPVHNKMAGYTEKGDIETGKMIYEYGCRHCHDEGGESDLLLDYSKMTFQYLKNNMFKDSKLSIYEIIRKGTYATPAARPYMPHYTLEKMSNRQVESLRTYIDSQVK